MKNLKKTDTYILNSRELEEIINEVVGIPLYPGYGWSMWEFHLSQHMNNDTSLKIELNADDEDFDEFTFIEVIQWCEKMHEANAYLAQNKTDIEAYRNFKHGDGASNEEYYSLSDKMGNMVKHLRSIGVEDRPEDYMGKPLLHALCYAKIIPPGMYLIEVSW